MEIARPDGDSTDILEVSTVDKLQQALTRDGYLPAPTLVTRWTPTSFQCPSGST